MKKQIIEEQKRVAKAMREMSQQIEKLEADMKAVKRKENQRNLDDLTVQTRLKTFSERIGKLEVSQGDVIRAEKDLKQSTQEVIRSVGHLEAWEREIWKVLDNLQRKDGRKNGSPKKSGTNRFQKDLRRRK